MVVPKLFLGMGDHRSGSKPKRKEGREEQKKEESKLDYSHSIFLFTLLKSEIFVATKSKKFVATDL